jgi:hypothetical protein
MDPDRRETRDSDFRMGPPLSIGDTLREGAGITEIRNTHEEDADRRASSTAISHCCEGRTASACIMQGVGMMASVHALSDQAAGCLHVAVPINFSGKKEDYRHFWRQIRLFLTTNKRDFQSDDSMIIFALSYMMEGAAEQWANAYVDQAIEEDNWGKWDAFLDALACDFRNHEEPCKVIEEMGRLFKGKRTALEYFLHLEQLASITGIDMNHSPHIILQLERGINSKLIDQLYLTDNPPSNYQEYKRRIITMDEMWKWKEVNCTNCTVTWELRDPNAMEVDQSKGKNDTRKCFICNETGHLVHACPRKEKKQDF